MFPPTGKGTKKGVVNKTVGPKLKGFLGVTKKKPEPDNKVVRSPKGVGSGTKAASSKARVERLKNLRI